jgi:hypothetical protein
MVTHADFHAAPITTLSQSMYDSLPPQYRQARVKPGMQIVVPDDLYLALGGKVETIHEPSQTPPALMELFPVLKQLIDDMSGHTDVMQGQARRATAARRSRCSSRPAPASRASRPSAPATWSRG